MSKNELSHDIEWPTLLSNVLRDGIWLMMVVAEVLDVEVEDIPIKLNGLNLSFFVVDLEENVFCWFHLNYLKLIQ